jgi:hypothetical protein
MRNGQDWENVRLKILNIKNKKRNSFFNAFFLGWKDSGE